MIRLISDKALGGCDKNHPRCHCLVDKIMNMCGSYLTRINLKISGASSCRCTMIVVCLRYKPRELYLVFRNGYLVKPCKDGPLVWHWNWCAMLIRVASMSIFVVTIVSCQLIQLPPNDSKVTHMDWWIIVCAMLNWMYSVLISNTCLALFLNGAWKITRSFLTQCY